MTSDSASPLELLAPARDLECGLAAIDHGADAVYIGAPQFGARAAAGNSLDDIRHLCHYAHRFLAKVYVTVNTIVFDHELDTVRSLVADLCQAGVDALLVQDMAVAAMARQVAEQAGSRMQVHASTQTDNRTAERVAWLRDQGFSRVVLARELSAEAIADIHERVPGVELEAFVHGALCVSYSGVCYASQYCFGRSANRGECAQFCRLKFTLTDANRQPIDRPRHWLSLRDMCRIHHLGMMADAGVTSFKIEGRLKDVSYVKNVVAAYSVELDRLVASSSGRWRRASLGRVAYTFTPNLKKTFNRGFTPYFIDGKESDIASPDTPKALGEMVGKVKEVRRDSFNVAGLSSFANGDGLCFFDSQHELRGFRVNRVEGNRIYPQHMLPQLKPGMVLYRNADAVFDKELARQSATRRIPLDMRLDHSNGLLHLTAHALGTDIEVSLTQQVEQQEARQPQGENMRQQLSRLGGTVYMAGEIEVSDAAQRLFVPSSVLADLRRRMVALMDDQLSQQAIGRPMPPAAPNAAAPRPPVMPSEYAAYPYLYNIANSEARRFYDHIGLLSQGDAFESSPRPTAGTQPPLLMQCRHCVRRILGACPRQTHRRAAWKEPLYLELPDRRRFRLHFDCQKCQMNVYAAD